MSWMAASIFMAAFGVTTRRSILMVRAFCATAGSIISVFRSVPGWRAPRPIPQTVQAGHGKESPAATPCSSFIRPTFAGCRRKFHTSRSGPFSIHCARRRRDWRCPQQCRPADRPGFVILARFKRVHAQSPAAGYVVRINPRAARSACPSWNAQQCRFRRTTGASSINNRGVNRPLPPISFQRKRSPDSCPLWS